MNISKFYNENYLHLSLQCPLGDYLDDYHRNMDAIQDWKDQKLSHHDYARGNKKGSSEIRNFLKGPIIS